MQRYDFIGHFQSSATLFAKYFRRKSSGMGTADFHPVKVWNLAYHCLPFSDFPAYEAVFSHKGH